MNSIFHNIWLTRLFVACSTCYGFWFIFNMDPYQPVKVRIAKGVWWTGLGHLALWLSTLNIRGPFRYLVVLISIISLAGLFLLWWNIHLLFAVAASVYVLWILLQLVRGKNETE